MSPDRESSDARIHPIAAWRAVRNLRKNPQDTQQVFLLTEALRGDSGRDMVRRFRNDPRGRELLVRRPSLLNTLTRHDWLASLPDGSLGRAYLDFVNAERLSAQGLVELSIESGLFKGAGKSDRHWVGARLRDMHDLFHVLSGYGRDELGEICVLAFSYPHQRTRSFLVLALAGAVRLSRVIGDWRVLGAVWQAWRHGCRTQWLPVQDLEGMLAENVDALRERLHIAQPTRYLAVLQRARGKGRGLSNTFLSDSSQDTA